MDKNKRISIIFSISYAVVLIMSLLFFGYDLIAKQVTNYALMIIILSGTFTFLVLNIILKEKME